ncbi:hypothetical protein [Enterococcus hirae]|uniref:hypothetical protein n=1 Tax=Enterococcus hirae TaxID=1354 RepID=UPI0009C0F38E|nr:hypothetical protein [Enterococcus hirae]OQO47451.1 hypothetical protein BH733_02420 [Enterococcus hirae]QNG04595.1 hypothetical protein FQ488_02265 [Enterococcus hirae]
MLYANIANKIVKNNLQRIRLKSINLPTIKIKHNTEIIRKIKDKNNIFSKNFWSVFKLINNDELLPITGINVTAKKRKVVANDENDRSESIILFNNSNCTKSIFFKFTGKNIYIKNIKIGISDISLFLFQNNIIINFHPSKYQA